MDRNGEIYRISRDRIIFRYRYSDIKEDTIILGGTFHLLPSSYEEINNSIKAVLEKRKDKFPIEFPSAGSIFKNPDGVSAGELIDRLGLKEILRGKAMVSNEHANIIVNLGDAKAEDVKELIEYIREKVFKEAGISLELEIECW